MTSRSLVTLLSALTITACGSSDPNNGPENNNNTGGTPPAGSGGAPTATGGSGNTPGGGGTPTASGGTAPVGTGGAGNTPAATGGAPVGTGGAVATGGAPAGTGGAPAGCDDSAKASASELCNPTGNPCNINSGYAGDAYCILPPPEGQGIQIHFGPKNYDDPAEIAKYLIKPGEEFNAYGLATIPGAGEHWYNYVQIRMRPGSHHLINQMVTDVDNIPDGFIDGKVGCPGTPVGGFPGTQNLIRNMPAGGKYAPENEGLGSELAANTKLCINHHGYNYGGDEENLREVWINVWFVPEAEVTQRTNTVSITAGPWAPIPARSKKSLTHTLTVPNDGRIVSLFGHRHAHTERFAAWKNDELIYDSWDWEESVVFDYDSQTTNPATNPDGKKDGAVSGQLPVKTGDKIKIQCDVNNTSDNSLAFRNELYTGEMCILFGGSVGVRLSGVGGQ